MTISLLCASRPHDDFDAEPHEFTAEGADYDQALAAAHASVPDGWVLLRVRRDGN